jgi:Recombination endonuclease VII
MKKCSKCKQEKELIEFAKDKHNPDGLTYRCKECRNLHYNTYYKNNPEKQKLKNDSQKENRQKFYSSDKGIISSRKAHLKRSFGISLKQYNEMSESQNHICAICHCPENCYRNSVLSVDHDHKTGEIRGLLCSSCNRALGLLKDNITNLINAIKYLKKNEKI